MQGRTINEILQGAKQAIGSGQPVSAAHWLDAAQRLSVLLQDLDEELVNAEMEYRTMRSRFIEQGESAASAETKAKATNAYRLLLGLKAKRERCAWFVQLAKKRVDLQTFDQ